MTTRSYTVWPHYLALIFSWFLLTNTAPATLIFSWLTQNDPDMLLGSCFLLTWHLFSSYAHSSLNSWFQCHLPRGTSLTPVWIHSPLYLPPHHSLSFNYSRLFICWFSYCFLLTLGQEFVPFIYCFILSAWQNSRHIACAQWIVVELVDGQYASWINGWVREGQSEKVLGLMGKRCTQVELMQGHPCYAWECHRCGQCVLG